MFKQVFAEAWSRLPRVLQRHYAVRAHSNDRVTVEGRLDIEASWVVRLMARLFHVLVPYSARAVPVTVDFYSGPGEAGLYFDRRFRFEKDPDYRFRSSMRPQPNGEVVEFVGFGLGWRMAFHLEGRRIVLSHRGYVLQAFGRLHPIPAAWLLGRATAYEEALDDDRFAMWAETRHPLFGKTFGYHGEFEILSVHRDGG